VFINEWMAANTATLADAADGDFDDWFELYNPNPTAADLSGYYLTDNVNQWNKSRIPDGTVIPAGGFMLVWADGHLELNATNRDVHTSFQLNRDGDEIGLYASSRILVDYVAFGPQINNVSQGRYPDGSSSIYYLTNPTPRAPNLLAAGNVNTAPQLASVPDQTIILGQTLTFTVLATDADAPSQILTFGLLPNAPGGAAIGAESGVFSWTPASSQAPSTNSVTVQVTDNGVPPMNATRTFVLTVVWPPALTVNLNGSQLTLGWATVAGKVYRIEYKDDLSAPTWTTLGSDYLATGASHSFAVDVSGIPQRFYRLRVVE
jgi:hypothetical protein